MIFSEYNLQTSCARHDASVKTDFAPNLREYKIHEMLMFAQVSHYTGGATRGQRGGRGNGSRGRWRQRNHSHLRQSNLSPFSNRDSDICFYCGESNHWVKNCPHRPPQPKHTLPTAPPVNSTIGDQQPSQYNP